MTFPIWAARRRDRYTKILDSGATPSGAIFNTVAALISAGIKAGDVIGVAAGSTFREQLTISVNNVTVEKYGTGDNPVFDCADTISSGWSKTGGYTNIYQVTLTTNYIVSEPAFCSVWEDTVRLPIVADLATLDSTPGAYFCADANTTSPVVYVHASDSGDPASNGSAYEMPVRLCGIYAFSAYGTTISGIDAKRNYSNGGSIKVGSNSILYDCVVSDGNKHSIYVSAGCRLTNITAHNLYYAGAPSSMFIYNKDIAAGENISFINCTAECDALVAGSSGFYGHVNVSGNFGTILYSGCTADYVVTGFDGANGNITLDNCTTTNCTRGMYVTTATGHTVSNSTIAGSSNSILFASTGQSLTVSNTTLTGEFLCTRANSTVVFDTVTIAGSANYVVYFTTTGASFTASDCAFSGSTYGIVFDAVSPVISLLRNTYTSITQWHRIVNGTYTLTSDYNTFNGADAANRFHVGGTNYNFAGYKTLTGQDANSTVTG